MVQNKAAKNSRIREQKQVVRNKAKEVMDLWRMLTEGLDVEHFTLESALVNTPDYNYYEKLMLYIIHKHAAHAELFPNLGDSKHERENDICILERHTVWLINNFEQIRSQDTAWSDTVSFVLQRLHMCSLTAEGPCWLEYNDLDSSLLEAVRQLEKDGLCFRKHSMYKATRHRWPALELHAHMKEREDEQGFEEDSEVEAEEEEEEGFGGRFSTAEEAEAAQVSTMSNDELQERLLQANEASKAAAENSDFYAAAAADGVLYRIEQELARRQQQQQEALRTQQEQLQLLCARFKDKALAWSLAAHPGQQRHVKPKVPPAHLHALQGILRSVLSEQLPLLEDLAAACSRPIDSPRIPAHLDQQRQDNAASPPPLTYSQLLQLPPQSSSNRMQQQQQQQDADADMEEQINLREMSRLQGMQLLRRIRGAMPRQPSHGEPDGRQNFVAGVRHLSDVEGNQLRAAATAPPSQLQEPNLQFGQQWPATGHPPRLGSEGNLQPRPGAPPPPPSPAPPLDPKLSAAPADWQPVFANVPPPPRHSISKVRSRAVDVRCQLEAVLYSSRGTARPRDIEHRSTGHVFRDALKMDARLGVYLKMRLLKIWKECSHKCHEAYGSVEHSQAWLERDMKRIDGHETFLIGHVLEALQDATAFGTREAYAAAMGGRTIAVEETCSEILMVLDAAGGVALRNHLELQLMANEGLTQGSWDRANSLLQEALEQLAHHEMVTFQYSACRMLVRLKLPLKLDQIHMPPNTS